MIHLWHPMAFYGILWRSKVLVIPRTIRWSRCDYVTCSQVTQIIPWSFQLRGRLTVTSRRNDLAQNLRCFWKTGLWRQVTQWPSSPGKHPVDHHWSRHHRWLMIRHCNNTANRGKMWENNSGWYKHEHIFCATNYFGSVDSAYWSQINGWSDGWQCAPIIIQYLDRYLTPSRHL